MNLFHAKNKTLCQYIKLDMVHPHSLVSVNNAHIIFQSIQT